MIHKIDNNNYYDYTKLKNVDIPNTGEKFSLDYKKNEPPSDKKEKKEVSDSEKEKQQAAEKNGVRLELSSRGQTAAKDGKKQAEAAKTQSIFGQSSLFDTVRTFFTTAVASIKDFFYKIWNDPQPSDALQEISDAEGVSEAEAANETGGRSGAAEEQIEAGESYGTDNVIKAAAEILNQAEAGNNTTETPPGSADLMRDYHRNTQRLDREIQPYLRKGDLNQVINLLTDNGKKSIARNSTLLTYYDRNGRMTEPNASDRERILYGDRNTRKL